MKHVISCCLNVRNETYGLRRCVESVRPWVDEVVIVDTGSTDGTQELARELADVFEEWHGCNDVEGRIMDVGAARNHAMCLGSGDVYLWLDGHDVLVGGEHLRELVLPEPGYALVVGLPYEYSIDQQGRCRKLQLRERLLYPSHAFSWRWPIHELCIAAPGTKVQTARYDSVRVKHLPGPRYHDFDPDRNLRVVQAHVTKHGDDDPRMVYYLGAELKTAGRVDEAITAFERFVQLDPEGMGDELCAAHLELCELESSRENVQGAVDWALYATQLRSWPEPFWAIGRAYYTAARRGENADLNWRRAAHHFELGQHLAGNQQSVLMFNPLERFDVERHLSVCYARIGDLDSAIESCRRGLAGIPDDPIMLANLAKFTSG